MEIEPLNGTVIRAHFRYRNENNLHNKKDEHERQ